MTGAWARFAATGDPTGPGLAWGTYDPGKDNYLSIDSPPSESEGWRKETCDFIDSMPH